MKTKALLFLLTTLFILPQLSEGQILNRAINRAQNKMIKKAERKLDDKFDEAIEKGLFKLGEAAKTKYGVIDEPINQTYSFDKKVNYEIYTSGKEKDATHMDLWISEGEYIGMTSEDQEGSFIIIDEEKMLTIQEEGKTYMALNFKAFADGTAIDEETEEKTVSIEKIGTETLLGYACNIYKITDDKTVSKIWLTDDILLPTGNFTNTFASLTNNSRLPSSSPGNGLLLKMESREIDKDDVYHMQATSVKSQSKSIDTSEYKNMMAKN